MRESREDAIRAFVEHQQRLHAIPNDDHPRWGLVLAPRDIGQMLLVLEQLESLLVTAWRGQACARWPIDSGPVRRVRDRHTEQAGSASPNDDAAGAAGHLTASLETAAASLA